MTKLIRNNETTVQQRQHLATIQREPNALEQGLSTAVLTKNMYVILNYHALIVFSAAVTHQTVHQGGRENHVIQDSPGCLNQSLQTPVQMDLECVS